MAATTFCPTLQNGAVSSAWKRTGECHFYSLTAFPLFSSSPSVWLSGETMKEKNDFFLYFFLSFPWKNKNKILVFCVVFGLIVKNLSFSRITSGGNIWEAWILSSFVFRSYIGNGFVAYCAFLSDRIEFWWFLAFSIWSPFGYLENGGNDTKGYDFGFCVLCCIGLSSVELVLYRVISAENIWLVNFGFSYFPALFLQSNGGFIISVFLLFCCRVCLVTGNLVEMKKKRFNFDSCVLCWIRHS